MDLPSILVNSARTGRLALLLTFATQDLLRSAPGVGPPSREYLARELAETFLDPSYATRPLAEVVELAISERHYDTVQSYLAGRYKDLLPDQAHALLPTFRWAALATTCIHVAIERAYDQAKTPLQRCSPIYKNGQSVDEALSAPGSLPLLKLHGCVTDSVDPAVPFILTPDQYATHRGGRNRLFERLESLAYEYPFVIFAESPSDQDFRAVVALFAAMPHPRPRSYVVLCTFTLADEKLLEAKGLSCIKGSMAGFLTALDGAIPAAARPLLEFVNSKAHPLERRIAVHGSRPSPDLISFLESEADLVDGTHVSTTNDPKAFYRGYFEDWSAIENNLDVRRTLADDITSEAILADADNQEIDQQLFAITGHAGSGKTVLLRRLAWDAATEYDRICVALRPSVQVRYAPVQELHRLTKSRILLFVDRLPDVGASLTQTLERAAADKIPITVIGTARTNAWHALQEALDSYLSAAYDVPYLDEREIDGLLALLAKHGSLGHLESQSLEQRREALAKKAGRQLLVALHEATLGKPFSDIVFDEFKSIENPAAQSLYLTTCVLHRLGVPVRAGLISRIHGIPFVRFKERLFQPLDQIVYSRLSARANDYEYHTRHPYIAEMVFERVLSGSHERFDEYVRIIGALDIDYLADRDAMRGLISARELLRLFSDLEMCRRIYKVAQERNPSEATIYQQEAIFEMKCGQGRFDVAAAALKRARELAPWNRSITHSLAELGFERSEAASTPAERAKLRRESKNILGTMSSGGLGNPADIHTLLKIHLEELSDAMNADDSPAFERKVKEIEKHLVDAHQRFPNDSYILDAESKFLAKIGDSPRALAALQRAFQTNKGSPYLALSLARACDAQGKPVDAIAVLKTSLEARPYDKDLHLALAKCWIDAGCGRNDDLLYHLRQAFTEGDNRHEAQFWYARQLYLHGKVDESYEHFRQLRSSARAGDRGAARAKMLDDADHIARCSGSIARAELNHAKVRRDQQGDTLVALAAGSPGFPWRQLGTGRRVTFEVAFNLFGPQAVNLRFEGGRDKAARKTRTVEAGELLPAAAAGPEVQPKEGASEQGEASVDLGLIIPLKEELRELQDVLKVPAEAVRDEELSEYYYRAALPCAVGPAYSVVWTMIGDMGPHHAAVATERMVRRWDPAILMMVGIAASLDKECLVGDVVIATQIDAYLENAKAVPKGGEKYSFERSGEVYRGPRDLIQMVRNFEFAHATEYQAWRTACETNGAAVLGEREFRELVNQGVIRDRALFVEGHLASGSIVAASTAFASWLRDRDRKVCALEMEAGGLMVASFERKDPVKTLVVRGLSDCGDERKAQMEGGHQLGLRKLAMRNVASLVSALVSAGVLPRRTR